MSKWTIDYIRNQCDEEADCWIWRNSVNSAGHPQANINGKGGSMVRRYIFTELMGKSLAHGRKVSSRCLNRLCCSPKCLVARTAGEILKASYQQGHRSFATEYFERVRRIQKLGRTVMDFEKAAEARQRFSQGYCGKELAKECGVTWAHMRKVLAGVAWRQNQASSSVFNWRP